jgi:integrase
MQVSKWLGHSNLHTDVGRIRRLHPREEDGGALNTLPEPPAPAKPAEAANNVGNLFGRQSG